MQIYSAYDEQQDCWWCYKGKEPFRIEFYDTFLILNTFAPFQAAKLRLPNDAQLVARSDEPVGIIVDSSEIIRPTCKEDKASPWFALAAIFWFGRYLLWK